MNLNIHAVYIKTISLLIDFLTSKRKLLPQCLIDQIQVEKPIQVAATDQMPDHT